ncbi:restriction endonuclease subunit S [Lentibacillus sp. Marseille-P4043]|uniref:restriction endonuclease subunit S n=1 Tax=Lentibacillus sp. Marseille-P4043 TaxID=2040293 RepID=UPI002D794841|nr:restriction endonuclease subunit S [Lentibacillus sp. Marseille-P4043]
MMFPQKKEDVPRIRFANFDYRWEQRKLGDLSEIRRGASPRPIQDQRWFDEKSEIGWLRISDVTEQDGRIYYVEQHISEEGEKRTLVLNEPHLILSIAATVGKPVINYIKTGIHDGFVVFMNPYFNKEFMFQWLEMYRPKWQKYGQPGSQVNINSELVKDQDILIPSLDEQAKIAKFFKRLNDTITLHQRRVSRLRQLKKGFLQMMFPQKKEDVPRIRFANFDYRWEQRKLGDLSEIRRGASPRPIQDQRWFDEKSEIGWLRISDVTEQDGRIYYVEQHISEEGEKRTLVLNEPHLILSIAATVGKPVINYIKTGIHDGFVVFMNPYFNKEFMFQWLEMYRPKWQKYGQPGSQVNINSELVKDQDILIPSLDEQAKIAKFFKRLNDTITLHHTKLEKLQSLKKAYLQKMFI